MRTPIPDYLDEIMRDCAGTGGGQVADYIPELSKVDPSLLAVAVCATNGHVYSVGDDMAKFTIQSMSKPFVYAAALEEHGLKRVLEVVDVEPSGEAFNELSLDDETGRPLNPMINAGAIAVNQLINGEESPVPERVEYILNFFSRLAGRELTIDHTVADSELEHVDRNLSLAHMLRSYDVIQDDAHDAVRGYVEQCSIEVDVRDLAVMAATLANGGVQPVTAERIISASVARQVQAVMASAGMYDAAGRWMTTVGIPAKSGVSGGMLGTLPGQLGLATFSPPLDGKGNSVAGARIFRRLSQDMGLHLMATEPYGVQTVRSIREIDTFTVVRIQGHINFSAAERFLSHLTSHDIDTQCVAIDLARVSGFNSVGRRIVLEAMRRLAADGRDVYVYDPDEVLPDPDLGDGTYPNQMSNEKMLELQELHGNES